MSLNKLAQEIYENNVAKGFYEDYEAIAFAVQEANAPPSIQIAVSKAFFGQRVALIHSELSEAIEANRKDLMDDKHPQHKGEHVELVDTIIRCLDTLAFLGADIDTVMSDVLNYNKQRPYRHGKAY